MDPFIIANFIPCFHCVKLHYSALMQLRASERASERERTDGRSFAAYSLFLALSRLVFFVGFNGVHRFSLAPEQFLVYINANRQDSSSRALVRNKSNSVANGTLSLSARLSLSLFVSLSPSLFLFPRTQIYTIHTRVHSRTIYVPLENGNAAAGLRFPVS